MHLHATFFGPLFSILWLYLSGWKVGQNLPTSLHVPHRGTLSPALSRQNRWNMEGRREEWKRARWRGEETAILDYSEPRRERERERSWKRKENAEEKVKGPNEKIHNLFQAHTDSSYMFLCRRCHSSCFQTFWLYSPEYKVTPTHLPTPKLHM